MPVKLYVIDQHQILDLSEIIEDTILIFRHLAKILIDLGATHSFVNPTFMYGLISKLINYPMI